MARILVVEPVAQPGLDLLTAAHETDVRSSLARDDVLAALAEGDGWDALVVRSQTRVDAELLAAAAPRLSVIGVASVGTDRIDVEAATRAGVAIVGLRCGGWFDADLHGSIATYADPAELLREYDRSPFGASRREEAASPR